MARRSLSVFISTFAAAIFAVIFFAGTFVAVPAQAQSSPGSFTVLHTFDYTGNGGAAHPIGKLVEDKGGDLFGVTETGGTGQCGYYTDSNQFVMMGCGTIYELVPQPGGGYTETTLYSFTHGGDALFPNGGLAMNSSGDLFGTTAYGGSPKYYAGTIFELTPPYNSPSDFKILYGFTGCAYVINAAACNGDGAIPSGQLVMDANGDLFGTTVLGGKNQAGTVFELPSDGGKYDLAANTLHAFTGTGTDGANPVAGPTLYTYTDSNNNQATVLFGATAYGGSAGAGTVFELSGSNYTQFTTLYSFTSVATGLQPYGALTVDGSGDLFGTTTLGGSGSCVVRTGRSPSGCGTIFELKHVGTGVSGNVNGYAPSPTTLYSFTGGNDGTFPATNLVIDGSGDLFGTTFYGGSNASTSACTLPGTNNFAYQAGCGTSFELKYVGAGVSGNVNGYAPSLTITHQFSGGNDGASPSYGLFMDGSGNIFGIATGGGNSDCSRGGNASFYGSVSVPGCGSVFELASTVPLNFEYAKLKITEGTLTTAPGFNLQADITPASTFDPATQSVTLTVGSYSATIPKGSFQVLAHGRFAGAWAYTGVINNVTVSVQIDPLDTDGDYEFKANASPVNLPANLTSINVSIQVGTNAGSTTVTPSY